MDLVTILLIIVIVLVSVVDFTNGFHDAADMVATAIASRAMSTIAAISIVSIFTFLGPFLIGLAVAETVGNSEYQQAKRDRKKVEVLFGHLKRILRFDQLRLRGLNGASDEFLLAVTAQNLRRMAKIFDKPPPLTG